MDDWRGVAALALAALALTGCARRGRTGGGAAGGGPAVLAPAGTDNPIAVYQRVGLLAESDPLPFVGTVGLYATPVPDSTYVLVSVSLAPAALQFEREGDNYRAAYALRVSLRRGDTAAFSGEAQEVVRLAVYRETTRDDESIIAQRTVVAPPGDYTLVVSVRDVGNGRTSVAEMPLTVRPLAAPALSTPLAIYDANPRTTLGRPPLLVASPRSTLVFGRDSTFAVYLEGYGGTGPFPVRVAVRGDGGTILWSSTAELPRRGPLASGVVQVPVSQVGVGSASLLAWPVGAASAPSDTVRLPLFVSFGQGLPVSSFEEMLTYLRFFASPSRLEALRQAAPAERARAWAQLLAETDPNPTTPQNEALNDYFQRIREANVRFREEGVTGWRTDRGMVYVALGEPDQVYEQGSADPSQRGRAQIWEYRDEALQLVFVDQSGFGRYRLTTASEADFMSALRRAQATR